MQHTTWSKDRDELASLIGGVLTEGYRQEEHNNSMNHGMFERLEGMHSIDGMANFIEAFKFIVKDIQADEPFETDDIIEYLTIKMANSVA